MMHFRPLEMDLSHVYLNGLPTCIVHAVHGCILVVHDAKNVYSELRIQIFNSVHGNGKMLLFFYIQRKNFCFTCSLYCLYVHRECSRGLSLSSFISVDIPIKTVDIFILTKLHEFVICKGAERIVRSKII